MLDLEERPLTRTPPAKSWRNWYRVYKRMGVTRNVGIWNPGVRPGPNIFPSKEMAEQKAHEFINLRVFPHARSWFDYMGAWPEGEELGG